MPEMKIFSERFPNLSKNVQYITIFLASIIAVILTITWRRDFKFKQILGTIIVVSLCFLVLYFFLRQFRQEVLRVVLKTFFILLAILTFLLVTRFVSGLTAPNIILIVPFAIIPVIIRTFYDAQLALFILLITIMLAGFMVPEPFVFILMSFISGMVPAP